MIYGMIGMQLLYWSHYGFSIVASAEAFMGLGESFTSLVELPKWFFLHYYEECRNALLLYRDEIVLCAVWQIKVDW